MGIVITACVASIESGERMRSVINNGGRLDYVITYSCSVIPYLPPRDKTRNRNAADLFQNGIRSIFRIVAGFFFNEIHLFLSTAWESDHWPTNWPTAYLPGGPGFHQQPTRNVHLELHKQQRLKTTVKHFFWIWNDPQKVYFRNLSTF